MLKSKASIHDMIRDLTKQGIAVLMISSELPEIIGMSDRILVMAERQVAGELPAKSSEQDIMLMATGHLELNHKIQSRQERNNMTTATVPGNGFRRIMRSIRIPPVYFFLIVIFLGGGLLDLVFADGQIFKNPAIMLNIVVRSVALGIVAVGQSLVLIGASIDLSVAYAISITAVMSSYMMQGKTDNVPLAILTVFGIGAQSVW